MPLTLSQTQKPSVFGEHELVAATRAGDDRAFEQLYSRYRDRILAFIAGKVRDHARAEDIAQDVFISALRRLRASDQQIAFKSWIYEIAKNACIDEFRRGNRSREVPLETDGQFVTDRQPTLSLVPTPAAAVEGKQRLDDLRGAFGGLSARHHRLLVMREFEGMTYDEIGDRLDMTRQMVESGLFRARRKLTEEYAELASGRRCEQVQDAIEAGTMQSVSGLGLRDRRRVARHLAHCQPCRHVALMAGVDETLVKPRSIAAKIAAFLPLPLSRWPWRRGPGGAKAAPPSHHLAATGLQNAAGLTEPVAGSGVLGPAAAAVAVLALAGAGGGLALLRPGRVDRPAAATRAADRAGHPQVLPAGPATRAPAARSALAGRGTASLRTGGASAFSPQRPPGSRRSQPGRAASSSGGSAPAASSGSASPSSGAKGVDRQTSGLGGVAGTLGSTLSGTTGAVSKTVGGVVAGASAAVSKTVGDTLSGTGAPVSNVTQTVSNAGGTVSKVAKPLTGTGQSVASGVSTTTQNMTSGSSSAGSNLLTTRDPSAASQTPATAAQPLQPAAQPLASTAQPLASAASQLPNGLGSK